MKFLLPLRHGLAAAARRPKLVLLVYLLSLLPAAAVALLAYLDLAELLNDSLFAGLALAGERMAVWNDYQRAEGSDFGLVTQAALLLAGLALVLHVLTAAGVVEALLSRERKREHPFLLGVGRHGWRFTRSALWFALALVPVVLAVGAAFSGINELARSEMDGRVHLAGWLAALVVSVLIYMFLDLAYDLSRIAAATHDEGRTFLGFFKALFHALRHPLILAPFWLLLSLLVVGLHLGYVAGRAAVQPENLLHVGLVLAVQQVVFLVAAFLRIALWGGEVAYYQAMGEPHWCGKGETRKERKKRKTVRRSDTGDEAGDEHRATPETAAPEPVDQAPEQAPTADGGAVTEPKLEPGLEPWDRRPVRDGPGA